MVWSASKLRVSIRWAAGTLYLAAGIALIVLGCPLASLPILYEDGSKNWMSWVVVSIPVWIGMVSSPGCLLAAVYYVRETQIRACWLRISLWGGVVATSAGIAGGSLMALFIPFSLVVLVGSIVFLRTPDAAGRSSRFGARRWPLQIVGVALAVFAVTLWALHAKHQG